MNGSLLLLLLTSFYKCKLMTQLDPIKRLTRSDDDDGEETEL